MFGKDAHIPSVQINYNVESRVGRGEAVRGRDRIYILPSESVRVLSLVPADATDIRDAPSWTFGDIEAQRFPRACSSSPPACCSPPRRS